MVVTSNRQATDSDVTVNRNVRAEWTLQAALIEGNNVPITNRFDLEDL